MMGSAMLIGVREYLKIRMSSGQGKGLLNGLNKHLQSKHMKFSFLNVVMLVSQKCGKQIYV